MTEEREFTCDYCKGEYVSTWSHEEALQEHQDNFPGVVGEMGQLCDDCYKEFMVWFEENREEMEAEARKAGILKE